MARIPVTHSAIYELYISDCISHIANGSAPNNRKSVVLRDSQCDQALLTPELQARCYEAYCAGLPALEAFVRANFFPVGRTENNRFWWSDNDWQ